MNGVPRLMAILLYGAGLRLLECARHRVKDVDFARNQITLRAGKGDKDRVTILPAAVKSPLATHLESVKRQHELGLQHNAGWVELPWALARKYPNAGRDWPRQCGRIGTNRLIEGLEAGADPEAVVIGISFADAPIVYINTIHIAHLGQRNETEIAQGLVVKTYPVDRGDDKPKD